MGRTLKNANVINAMMRLKEGLMAFEQNAGAWKTKNTR